MLENSSQEIRQEKRIFARFTARFPLKYQNINDQTNVNVFCHDASAQGLKLTTNRRMFINDSISLLIDPEDGFDPMTLNGKVVWTKMKSPNLWDVGLKFHKTHLMKMHRLYGSATNQSNNPQNIPE